MTTFGLPFQPEMVMYSACPYGVHFLTCFVSLVLARILQLKMINKYSITKMLEGLRKCECSYAQQYYYLFNYCDDVLLEIESKFNLDFTKRIRSLGEIKKLLSETKK